VDSWFGIHPTGRLALRYDPNPAVALRLSGGTGFRAPTFKEMFLRFENAGVGYVVEGSPDLRPESSWGLSAGAELTLPSGFRAGLDLFHTQLDDMITIGLVQASTPEAPAGEYGYVNVAAARTTGGEARVGWRAQAFDVDLGYSYTDTEDLDLERALDGRAPHRGTVALTGRPAAWGLTATARAELVGPATFFQDEDGSGDLPPVVTEPYLNLKARVEKSLWKRRLRVFVGVDNLLDAGDALYVHLDPRLWYAGATLAWPGAEPPRSPP
jgi:outer membrane receptor for ferrienterochelin and colicins